MWTVPGESSVSVQSIHLSPLIFPNNPFPRVCVVHFFPVDNGCPGHSYLLLSDFTILWKWRGGGVCVKPDFESRKTSPTSTVSLYVDDDRLTYPVSPGGPRQTVTVSHTVRSRQASSFSGPSLCRRTPTSTTLTSLPTTYLFCTLTPISTRHTRRPGT